MKVSILALPAIAALAAAQRMADALPECAVECLENGIESATDCALDDGDCICEVDNYRNTYDVSQACVLQACGAARSLDEVLPAAAGFCDEVTGGAIAPPVDESPSASTTTTSTTASASGSDIPDSTHAPNATGTDPTPSSEESGAGETDEPDAAGMLKPVGFVGMAAMGAGLFALL